MFKRYWQVSQRTSKTLTKEEIWTDANLFGRLNEINASVKGVYWSSIAAMWKEKVI